jgi:hypothetical protein
MNTYPKPNKSTETPFSEAMTCGKSLMAKFIIGLFGYFWGLGGYASRHFVNKAEIHNHRN